MGWQSIPIDDQGQLTDHLTTASIAQLHPLIRTWVADDQLRRELRSTMTEHIRLIDDAAFAAGLSRAMPVAGATHADYRIQLVHSPSGLCVAGIRFRREPSFAFIEVYARDILLDTADLAANLISSLSQLFGVFAPRFVRLHVAEESVEHHVLTDLGGVTDFLTVAAPMSLIRQGAAPHRLDRVRVIPVTSAEYYPRYRREYEAFHQRHPRLRDRVPVASFDTLEHSRSIGALVDVLVDGAWAGMVAGRPQTTFGMTGFRIVEELLNERCRGLGLGAATQRRFIEALPVRDTDVIHGAIDPLNVASRRTAASVGRVEVMRTMVVPLPT